jgi:hypothetical protein
VNRQSVITTPTGKVGYILLNTFSPYSTEKGLADAIAAMKTQGVSDVVLDLRYNGGGLRDCVPALWSLARRTVVMCLSGSGSTPRQAHRIRDGRSEFADAVLFTGLGFRLQTVLPEHARPAACVRAEHVEHMQRERVGHQRAAGCRCRSGADREHKLREAFGFRRQLRQTYFPSSSGRQQGLWRLSRWVHAIELVVECREGHGLRWPTISP